MIFSNNIIQIGATKDPISREAFIYLNLPFMRHVSLHGSWVNRRVAERVMREGLH